MLLFAVDWLTADDVALRGKGEVLGGYGASLFHSCCEEAGLTDFTTVAIINARPRHEKPENFFHKGQLLPELQPHVDAFLALAEKATYILCAGYFGFTLLTGIKTKIATYRGNWVPLGDGRFVMLTFDPRDIRNAWHNRPIFISDLAKAARRNAGEPPSIGNKEIYIIETLPDLRALDGHPILAVDVETANKQITCIGFATSPEEAYVVPIWNGKTGESYWSAADEIEVWLYLKALLEDPDVTKIFQNCAYDLFYLSEAHGIHTRGTIEDTMIAAHALQPEMPKSLGFLASFYLDNPSWKHLRTESADKKDAKRDA